MPTNSAAQDITFIQFGQKEGLAHSQILDIAQDKNGNLWVGTTTRSIYRFDGKKFHQYKISIPNYEGTILTFRVLPDASNNILVLTNLGLLKFDGITSTPIHSNYQPVAGVSAKLFHDQNEHPWLIDDKGDVFQILQDSAIKRTDIRDELKSGAVGYYDGDNKELFFYSRSGATVSQNQNGEVTVHQFPRTLPIQGAPILEYDRTKELEIIATPGKIHIWSAEKWEAIELPEPVKKYGIRDLVKDRNGLIWGLSGNALFVIKDNLFQMITGTEMLVGNFANRIFKDKEGDVWIAVDGLGLVKYKKQAWHKIPETTGKDITAIIEIPPSNKLIFGTYAHGLIGFGPTKLIGKPITSLSYSNEHDLLAGTLGTGMFHLTETSEQRMDLTSSSIEYVHGVTSDKNRVIAATQTSLMIKDGNKKKSYVRLLKGRPIPMTNPIIINDTVYFAGMSGGLMKIVGDSVVVTGPSFLKESTIYNIRKQPWGDYVITGEFSKILFFDSTFSFKYFIDLQEVLSNVLIIEFIDRSTAIIGSNDGLFKVMFENQTVRSIRKYGKENGYGEEELYAASSKTCKNGEIAVGTINGAYVFTATDEEINSIPPTAYLTAVDWINQTDTPDTFPRNGYFQLPANPRLSHEQNSITLTYDYSNLSNSGKVTFRHQLEGIEKEWSPVSTAQQVTYSTLRPGNYTFMLQGISEDKIYGNIAKYNFTIVPAFWQTPVFYLLIALMIVLLILCLIWWVSTYRIRRHKLETEIRNSESVRIRKQMSMDFHDEMGNKLAGMLAQASLLKVKHAQDEFAKVFGYFENSAYAIFHGTKDFIWTIDVSSNNLKEVISYLRDFGYQFFERNEITFHVENSILDETFNRRLPDGYNRQIILIFKEAMTNAFKHAHCKNVYLSANIDNNIFEMTFSDDGTWRKESLHRNGIRNMQLRAQRMNATFTLTQKTNRTLVSLSFKIQTL
jgi:signal transduction histidine kinase